MRACVQCAYTYVCCVRACVLWERVYARIYMFVCVGVHVRRVKRQRETSTICVFLNVWKEVCVYVRTRPLLKKWPDFPFDRFLELFSLDCLSFLK